MKRKLMWLIVAATAFTLTACTDSSGTTASDTAEYGDVTLGTYKGLTGERPVYSITDSDITDQIEALTYDYAEYNTVDRASKEGDYVTVNMTVAVDDEVVLDYSSEEYELCLGNEEFGADFDTELTGVSTGDQLDFSLEYEDDYEDDTFAGNTVTYSVSVLAITEEVLPELTDEFVQDSLEYDSYDAMVAELTTSLEEENDSNSDSELRENLLQQVIDSSTFTDYSQDLYDSYAASIEENYASYAEMFGYETTEDIYEMFGMTEEDIEKEVLNQVYRTIVVHAIADAEQITVSDDEYQDSLSIYAQENEYDSTDDMVEEYGEESIREWILEDKVLDLLEENATVTEVASTEEV